MAPDGTLIVTLADTVHYYNTALGRSRKVPVHSTIILLRPAADGPDINGLFERRDRNGDVYDWFRYHVAKSSPDTEVRRMARPRWQRLTIKAVKSTVTLVVIWAVARHVLRTWTDLHGQSRSLHFEPGWLIGSGLFYLAGLAACGRFFDT